MVSRLTIADRRTRNLVRRCSAFAGCAALVGLTLAAVGCPARQATIEVSETGIATLVTSCRPCARVDDAGVEPPCACVISDHVPLELEHHAVQARMFLITPGDNVVRDSSKCMTLLPCADAARSASCIAESLNQQLDGAIPRGVGFDGLKNPDEVQLVLAVYQPLASTDTAVCSRADLVACAGLAPPLGGGNYDISCASCQGGGKNAAGPDNGPCPRPKGSCFLQECLAILAQNDL